MSHRPNRRTVVRAAVWTAPAVAVATAAPALAASTTSIPILRFDTLNLFGADYVSGDPTTLESQVQVQNVYAATSPTLTTMTLTMTYPDTRTTGGAPTHVTGSGWSFSNAQHVAGTWIYTFVWGGSIAPGRSTSTLDFRVPLAGPLSGTVVVTGAAFAAGGSTVGAASYKFNGPG